MKPSQTRRYEDYRNQMNAYLRGEYDGANKTKVYKNVPHITSREKLSMLYAQEPKKIEAYNAAFKTDCKVMFKAELKQQRNAYTEKRRIFKPPWDFMSAQTRDRALKDKVRGKLQTARKRGIADIQTQTKTTEQKIVNRSQKAKDARVQFLMSSDNLTGRVIHNRVKAEKLMNNHTKSKPKRSR